MARPVCPVLVGTSVPTQDTNIYQCFEDEGTLEEEGGGKRKRKEEDELVEEVEEGSGSGGGERRKKRKRCRRKKRRREGSVLGDSTLVYGGLLLV
ncbi:hypothetical protein BHM03_00050795 [Ensete ventricosum]|nr:hypothetical protein BHM03_00050795 [Ensete ventricosum]